MSRMSSRLSMLLGLLVLGTGLALAQAPSSALAAGSKVNAQLKSKLDTRHAKVGDKVTAVTTSDVKENGVKVLPKGSTLTGHVTEVTRAESSKSPSRIGVLFDRAVTKQGQTIPMRAGIASVLTSSAAAAAMGGGMGGMDSGMGAMGGGMDGGMGGGMGGGMSAPMPAGGGGGLLGGVGGAANGVLGAGAAAGPVVANGAGMVGGELGASGPLSAGGSVESLGRASNGVPVEIAMPPAGAQASQQAAFGSVLSTPRGDMELNSGTNVALQTLSSPSASAAGTASASGHAHAR